MNVRAKLEHTLFTILMVSSMSGCAQQSVERVQWQGLCIPKDKVGWLQPGPSAVHNGWLSSMLGHLKPELDRSAVPKVTVTFHEAELAAAIPGYVPTVTGQLGYTLHLGSVVSIKPMKYATMPHQEAYIGIFRDVWNLTSTWSNFNWANSKIISLKGANYYKIIPEDVRPYDDFFVLSAVNPRHHQPNDPPFENISAWYIGDCGPTTSTGFRCDRALLGKKFYIQYTVEKPNITLVNKIDRFMINHIHQWAKACKGQIASDS